MPLICHTLNSFGREVGKIFLQIISVSVIGTTAALLLELFKTRLSKIQKENEKVQEQAKIRNQMKLDFIKRIGELYRSAKKSRRLLRSRGIVCQKAASIELDQEQIKYYSKKMLKLNDVQLELEGFKIASENNLLFENDDAIFKHLERMENYLNNIIDQFEKGYRTLEPTKKINFKDYKFLWEFTADSKNEYLKDEVIKKSINSDGKNKVYYCFEKLFSVSYAEILGELREKP
jgi:hypothetical protein